MTARRRDRALAVVLGLTISAAPATTTISIAANNGAQSFAPNPATAVTGDSLVWRNDDFSVHRIVLDDGSLDTGNINPGASSPPMTLTGAGGRYHCAIHPDMVGTLSATPCTSYPGADRSCRSVRGEQWHRDRDGGLRMRVDGRVEQQLHHDYVLSHRQRERRSHLQRGGEHDDLGALRLTDDRRADVHGHPGGRGGHVSHDRGVALDAAERDPGRRREPDVDGHRRDGAVRVCHCDGEPAGGADALVRRRVVGDADCGGSSTFTVRATNASGCSTDTAFTLTVVAAVPTMPPGPSCWCWRLA